ncbi:MAG: (2Fe-2S) ferredoxin domain-containing protein [Candidatus Delongbacteria bacterium]|nr:(2Fe-2S) ferredoxin domain-containing protein [Candidatus Delongbacteria bacterium]
MKSLAELRSIKEKALKNIQARTASDVSYTITVGMGTCGIAAGARETLKTILDEIQRRNLETQIRVIQSGCAGFCTNEPMITIEDQKGNKVTYQRITADKVNRIFNEHIVNHVVVSDYVFNVVH